MSSPSFVATSSRERRLRRRRAGARDGDPALRAALACRPRAPQPPRSIVYWDRSMAQLGYTGGAGSYLSGTSGPLSGETSAGSLLPRVRSRGQHGVPRLPARESRIRRCSWRIRCCWARPRCSLPRPPTPRPWQPPNPIYPGNRSACVSRAESAPTSHSVWAPPSLPPGRCPRLVACVPFCSKGLPFCSKGLPVSGKRWSL